MTNLQIAVKYANDIISEKIKGCIYVKQSCQRFLDNLKDERFYYDATEVDLVVAFINGLYLTEMSKPTHFILAPWQTFIVCNLYGLYDAETKLRKYSFSYIELARKNGKSQLVIALALWHLIRDPDSQVVIGANSLRQIKDVDFKKVKQFCNQLDRQQKYLVQYYNSVKYKTNELLCTASDASKLDGLNISFCLLDEFHEAKNNALYNVFKSAMGNRDEPLMVIITTSGFNTESYCYQLRQYYTEILSGKKVDESQFAIIYTIDKDDKIDDKSIWVKANPNLGVSVREKFLEGEVIKAMNNEIERPGVMVKHMNVWLKSNIIDIWLPDTVIQNSMKSGITLDDKMFEGCDIYCGVDLGAVSDIAAVSYFVPLDDTFYFFNEYYLPKDNLNTNINRDKFNQAATLGQIHLTEGNVMDADYILEDILKRHRKNFIIKLFYDRWNSRQFAIDATNAGLNLEPFSQLPGSLNKPLKDFEMKIRKGEIVIQKNDITFWMMQNVQLKINVMGNYSIDKSSKNKKIDGVAAMMNALGGYLETTQYNFDVT